MASLAQTRVEFSLLVSKLLLQAEALGFHPALSEVARSDEQAAINALGGGGRARLANLLEADFPTLAMAVSNNGKGNGILMSVHRDRVAVDLDLYQEVEGRLVYRADAEAHQELGEWWEGQHPLARWGGRFRDANHYSFEWQGRK